MSRSLFYTLFYTFLLSEHYFVGSYWAIRGVTSLFGETRGTNCVTHGLSECCVPSTVRSKSSLRLEMPAAIACADPSLTEQLHIDKYRVEKCEPNSAPASSI
ncbi:hypothetical protein N656DRAFT_609656 [Canariomyces notabilis]|uniref:Uncharacterized protein n=1 Tax=Canariomyces notabilis TaxID=2074819 RepID=A0AAN6TGC8_9PEZI|nr:hypothetical protein N656DRAFT_609656 [Canariomyces arenarius]